MTDDNKTGSLDDLSAKSIADIVDAMVGEAPKNDDQYTSIRDTAIENSAKQIKSLLDSDLSQGEINTVLLATISFLMIENIYLLAAVSRMAEINVPPHSIH